MQQEEKSIYERYCTAGRRFEIAGALLLAAALAGYFLLGGAANALVTIVFFAGFALLIFGAMNMKRDNLIRAFASQLSATNDPEFARSLIEAMEKGGVTALPRNALNTLNLAIQSYAASENADEALVDKLCEAYKKYIRKRRF